ncbi:MAG: hypothetical protein BZY70_02515 [SAR202 cluster bacterium MP-SInd-SRR3963457-G2]|nr:MAG: hypothetical protein BZY70_02515 [SAR202 cluster bacterium MP-SInd-SRR3963457-G2]
MVLQALTERPGLEVSSQLDAPEVRLFGCPTQFVGLIQQLDVVVLVSVPEESCHHLLVVPLPAFPAEVGLDRTLGAPRFPGDLVDPVAPLVFVQPISAFGGWDPGSPWHHVPLYKIYAALVQRDLTYFNTFFSYTYVY